MIFWMIGIVLFTSVIAFFVIARKGRKLRTMRVLPGEATNAVVESVRGRRYKIDSQTHFYFGKHPECQVIVNTSSDYAVCIFHHRRRFAFETLSNARGIQVN